MKWRINGRIYDTETSRYIEGDWPLDYEARYYKPLETLYRKRNGEHFVIVKGYICPIPTGGWCLGTTCAPLTEEETEQWLDGDITAYDALNKADDEEYGWTPRYYLD